MELNWLNVIGEVDRQAAAALVGARLDGYFTLVSLYEDIPLKQAHLRPWAQRQVLNVKLAADLTKNNSVEGAVFRGESYLVSIVGR